ncbi:MAG: glycosyltransferase family 2 protein [Pirellulales bacterium]
MPRVTIVISAVGSIPSLESTLVSVLENRPSDCEILVALAQPYADPYQLAGEVRFVQAKRRSAMVACLNDALRNARAPFVHLLSSGCTVSEGWIEPALARFGDKRLASVAPLVMDAEPPHTIVAAGLSYRRGGRRRLLCRGEAAVPSAALAGLVGPCGFAAFYRKSAVETAGGLCPALGLAQADVELAITLARMGLATALEPQSVVSAGRELEAQESALQLSLHEERLFWRNLPERGRAAALIAHTGLVAADTLRALARPASLVGLAGRALACCQVGGYVRRHALLKQLGSRVHTAGATREGARFDSAHSAPSLARASNVGASSR